MTDAVPHHYQDQHHHHGQNAELPLGKLVIPRAFIKRLQVEFFTDAGIFHERLTQCVLHTLGRLSKKTIHVAVFQKLHQFG